MAPRAWSIIYACFQKPVLLLFSETAFLSLERKHEVGKQANKREQGETDPLLRKFAILVMSNMMLDFVFSSNRHRFSLAYD